jgi:homoserine kinase type II
MQYLRGSGLPVPAVLEHVGGTTFLVLDGECYEIHEYIEGEPYDHSNGEHFRAAALFLGLYHTYVQGLEQEGLCCACDLYSPSILRANLATIREAWKLDENSALTRTWHQLTAQADALAEHFARHEKLPHVIIHGDYHGDNLLFKDDHIVGVVDYDKARWQPRVVELAEALIYFASARPGHLKHLVYPGFLNWAKFNSFLRYYCRQARDNARRSGSINTFSELNVHIDQQGSAQLHSLRDAEIYALSAFIRCIWLSVSLQRLLEKDAGHVAALEALQEVLELGEWGANNRERMIENTYAALRGTS